MTKIVPYRVGSYLGRDVQCSAVDGVDDFVGLVVDQSLVLIDTADTGLNTDEETRLAEQIIRLRPLGVFFTGAAAERMFVRLLRALDTPGSPLPVMTNFSSDVLPEAVEEFLSSTWPAEQFWERWRGYVLVSVGGSALQLEQAARRAIEGDGADP
jgi:hypothetical protein